MSAIEKETEIVEEQVEETVVGREVLNAGEIDAAVQDIADEAMIDNFTAPRSNVSHGHGLAPDQLEGQHDVRRAFNVRDEFVEEFFGEHGIAPNDHAALWLMAGKKEEAIEHDQRIFQETHDSDESRWKKINSTKKVAPISAKTKSELGI